MRIAIKCEKYKASRALGFVVFANKASRTVTLIFELWAGFTEVKVYL